MTAEHRGLDHKGVMRDCVQEIHFCGGRDGIVPVYDHRQELERGDMTTGRRKKDPLDRYDTPSEATEALLELQFFGQLQFFGVYAPRHILEPAAGAGSMVDVLRARWPTSKLTASDIAPRRADIEQADFLASGQDSFTPPVDLIITNPPFSASLAFAQRGLEMLPRRGHLVLLLRLAFLESIQRHDWLTAHMPLRIYVFSKRPSFDGKSTDSAAYAWFIWERGYNPVFAELRLL